MCDAVSSMSLPSHCPLPSLNFLAPNIKENRQKETKNQ